MTVKDFEIRFEDTFNGESGYKAIQDLIEDGYYVLSILDRDEDEENIDTIKDLESLQLILEKVDYYIFIDELSYESMLEIEEYMQSNLL